MDSQFPMQYDEIKSWSDQEGVNLSDAGKRYAQYLVLRAISRSNELRSSIVFKGGNALEFVYLPNRSTTDLDFSFIDPVAETEGLTHRAKQLLDTALKTVPDEAGTILRLQSFKKNPPRPDATFVTLAGKVAYALPDQPLQQNRLLTGEPGANVIPVEMSMNEVVCAWNLTPIGDQGVVLNTSSIDDIVAEKLRAILQQTSRNRYRSQDVIDIASIIRDGTLEIDRRKIAEFLLRKSAARGVPATMAAFRDPDLERRSEANYDALRDTVRHTFIPFDEAWETVMNLVDSLDIPD
ncbi:MAG: nucleotidyl transferase AbiEii/AbiGii toxin family protein [Thermomicrobiales bacterium]|nr:nucleotidyl transferase AbiEii/AbiGii toxin family protein [Thermomicrobiales bacterium]MCO5224380.1 nucleotidyl transferase AbiEii/AbiGii toxin family protein [Thermomicrobiales bacterium]MCO5228254.1 nucleotidyl transferase AbiEii/AbiGii toxin family protein [Thermomicrobiales bacterium]